MVTNVGAKQLDFGAPAFNDVVATASASVASVSIDKMFGSDINGEAIAANTLGSFIGNQLAAQAKQHYADYQAKKAFEAELKISQIPTIHQEIEASERRFIQSIAAHPNDQGSAPSSPQSSQGGNSRVASAKSTPPHKPQGNAGNSGGSDAVSFEASRSHVEVASAQREKHMSRAQRWNEESHRAKTQPPRSSQASKNGFWSVLEEMGDSRFIAMVNEVGNSLNPFITIPRDVGDAVHAFQSGQTADGFKAVGSVLLDATVVLPIDGVVVKGIGYGAKGVAGLGSKVGLFGKTAGSVEHLTTKERVFSNLARSRVARDASNFEIHALIEEVPTLNIRTGMDEAVFWSGPGNRQLAESFASSTNKLTLEMTSGGRYLDSKNLFDRYSTKQAIIPWERLSARFAQGASAKVSAFSDTSRVTSVFNRIEYPILRKNPNVTEIIFSPEIKNVDVFRP